MKTIKKFVSMVYALGGFVVSYGIFGKLAYMERGYDAVGGELLLALTIGAVVLWMTYPAKEEVQK